MLTAIDCDQCQANAGAQHHFAMSNPNPTRPPYEATKFTADRQPKRVNLIADAREMEQLVMTRARNPRVRTADLASLVRSFVSLLDAIRVLRGIPSPGQLRPDLDPVQAARMLKRLRARQPLEIGSAGAVLLDDEGTPAAIPTNGKHKGKGNTKTMPAPALDLDPGEGREQTPNEGKPGEGMPALEPQANEDDDAGAEG